MRETRKQQAEQTLQALERGAYRNAKGEQVVLADALRACVAHTHGNSAEAAMRLETELFRAARRASTAVIGVTQETFLQASARLARGGEWRRVGVLNFASAYQPGGDFQSGAPAQEESLARASGLYASLSTCPEFYAAHQRECSLSYSDRMIHSPACPVFRTDDGAWLETPLQRRFRYQPGPQRRLPPRSRRARASPGARHVAPPERPGAGPRRLRRPRARRLGAAGSSAMTRTPWPRPLPGTSSPAAPWRAAST
jgi:uncharacterized protein (TIGR02452 family)